jgi:1-acyl-sn-glycerol-3-phosphate acyltransferase
MSRRTKKPFAQHVKVEEDDLGDLYVPLTESMHSDFENDAAPEIPDEGKPYDPIDFPYLYSLARELMVPIIDHYYRARMIGAENLPESGPAIIACNHSGNAFPHDAMVLDGLIWRHFGFKPEHKMRSVYSPKLAKVWWMRPFGLDNWWRRCGGVDMTFDNYDRLLKNGERVVYYPEGVPGIGKGFNRRYQLQHFYSSFVVLSARHNVSITPVSCVNAEYINPFSYTWKWLDAQLSRYLGIPFFPFPIVFLALLFPFIFYFGFPCNMVFRVGRPVSIRKLIEEAGGNPLEPSREVAQAVAEKVRQLMQVQLSDAVAEFGAEPYKWSEWWNAMKTVPGSRLAAFPTGWPYLFLRHERDLQRKPPRNSLHAFLRDWDILLFYIPLGWIFIGIVRALRKAPYGYRGMSHHEWMKKTGSYLWLLEKRPIATKPGTRKADMKPVL